jgi:hypothetical protein
MTLPPEVGDREYQKFVETDAGDVAVRVQGSDINGLDPGNSTVIELPINGQFIGAWLDVNGYSAVQVSLLTQNKGTLYMEWTNDEAGVTADTIGEFDAQFSETTDNPGKHEFLIRRNHKARYYRTRYLNNGFAQTNMHLTTFQGKFNAPDDAMRIRDAAGNQANLHQMDSAWNLATHDTSAYNLLNGIWSELKRANQLLESIAE